MTSDHHDQFVETIVVELEAAGAAEFDGDNNTHAAAIDRTSSLLEAIFVGTPHQLPAIVDALAQLPAVRIPDLRLALLAVQRRYPGSNPIVLTVGAHRFITDAAGEHGVDPDRIAALVVVTLADNGQLRPQGLPVHSDIAKVVRSATFDELRAARRVSDLVAEDIAAGLDGVSRLVELIGNHDTGGTYMETIAAMTGDDRVEAEQILARLPAAFTQPG